MILLLPFCLGLRKPSPAAPEPFCIHKQESLSEFFWLADKFPNSPLSFNVILLKFLRKMHHTWQDQVLTLLKSKKYKYWGRKKSPMVRAQARNAQPFSKPASALDVL